MSCNTGNTVKAMITHRDMSYDVMLMTYIWKKQTQRGVSSMQLLNMVCYTVSQLKEKEKDCQYPWGWPRIRWAMCGTPIFPTCKLTMPMDSQELCPHKTIQWGFSLHRHQTWCCHPHTGQKPPSTKLKTPALLFLWCKNTPQYNFPKRRSSGKWRSRKPRH